MSEFIICENCGELTSYDRTTYINENTICPTCFDKQTIDPQEG